MGTLAVNTSMGSVNGGEGSGFLFGHLEGKGGSDSGKIVETLSETAIAESDKKSYIPLAKIASASPSFIYGVNRGENIQERDSEVKGDNINVLNNKPADSSPLASFQNNSLLALANCYSEGEENLRYGIVKYTVQPGDTLSSIAYSFGITTNTLFWANKDSLESSDYIKPGQKLTVLPITGVLHEVKETDTVEKIAQKYKADSELIIQFTDLPADGNLENKIGKTLIIPNGSLPAPPRLANTTTNQRTVASASKYRYVSATNRKGHNFPYGYCTWYVATKRYVPWGGHAKYWLTNARAYGYQTSNVPTVGSIVVTAENRWYGHVAYVEAVHGNTITVSEMNYVGWGIKSVRTLSANSRVIRGYIH